MADSIICPRCGRTSWNENDVRERWCGACDAYHLDAIHPANLAPRLWGELWKAVNHYTVACGGDTGDATVGSIRAEAANVVDTALCELLADVLRPRAAEQRTTRLRVRLTSDRPIPAGVNLQLELHEIGSGDGPLVTRATPDGAGAIDLDATYTLEFP